MIPILIAVIIIFTIILIVGIFFNSTTVIIISSIINFIAVALLIYMLYAYKQHVKALNPINKLYNTINEDAIERRSRLQSYSKLNENLLNQK
jgi:hypothetical protein